MKQALNILIAYLTCTDPVIQNKWLNLLHSFWHKDSGWLLKSITTISGGYRFTVLDGDGNETPYDINIPTLPNSQPMSYIDGLELSLNSKVDKVVGKGLSTNDFTTALKNKLDGLQNYVHPDFHQISEIEGLQDLLDTFAVYDNLAEVAKTNDYNDLDNKPVFKAVQNEYADMAALYADQGNQTESLIQYVTDASAHTEIESGGAYFEYFGTTNGDETDYRLLSSGETSAFSGMNDKLDKGGYAGTAQDLKDEIDAKPGSGGGDLSYQAEITASDTILDGSQKGLNKVYPFNSASNQTVQINAGDYVLNDVINIERRGFGSLEILWGGGVRIRGVRDINNRYFVNDTNSIVALLCRGGDEFSIIGNLKRGYTGAVTTSSYGSLIDGGGAQNITVVGTGFSENMIVSVAGNATLNSWVYVNPNQITLNLTENGAVNDSITVTYDNGDVFVDTDAITIVDSSYDTANLRHYYPLSANSNDAVASGAINGTDTDVTYSSGEAVFNGSSSYIDFGDDDSFSFGDGSVDDDFSISFIANFDDVTPVSTGRLINKWLPSEDREYTIYLTSAGLLTIQFFDESVNNHITKSYDISGFSISTDYHFVITKSGSTVSLYVNGSSVTLTDASQATYTAMENLTSNFSIGAQSDGTVVFDGGIKRVGLWDVALDAPEVSGIHTEELTNDNDLL